MGTPKQLLHVDGKPMLLGIVEALLEGGAAGVTVVATSAMRHKLPPLPARARVAVNDDPLTEMIDSVRIGIAAAGAHDGFLVCPSDAAGITAADVRRCAAAFAAAPDRIVIATHAGRRGHPTIVPASLADAVRSPLCNAGLNQLARRHPELVIEVACDSAGPLANVNTPADYEKLT